MKHCILKFFYLFYDDYLVCFLYVFLDIMCKNKNLATKCFICILTRFECSGSVLTSPTTYHRCASVNINAKYSNMNKRLEKKSSIFRYVKNLLFKNFTCFIIITIFPFPFDGVVLTKEEGNWNSLETLLLSLLLLWSECIFSESIIWHLNRKLYLTF